MASGTRHFIPGPERILLKDFVGAALAQYLVKAQIERKIPFAIVVDDGKQAESLKDEISFFQPQARVEILPAFDVRPYYGLTPHRDIALQNIRFLHHLLTGAADFVIAPQHAVFRRVIPKGLFFSLTRRLAVDDHIGRDDLVQNLVKLGYEREVLVEEPGQFAVRGDIVDIFSPQYAQPFRLSFFDTELEDIKFFNADSQRTQGLVKSVEIIVASEVLLGLVNGRTQGGQEAVVKEFINENWYRDLKTRADKKDIPKLRRDQIEDFVRNGIHFHGIPFFLPLFYKNLSTVFDYFAKKTTLVLAVEGDVPTSVKTYLAEMEKNRAASAHIESIFSPEELFLTVADWRACEESTSTWYHENGPEGINVVCGETESNQIVKARLKSLVSRVHTLAPLAAEINDKRLKSFSCMIVCQNDLQRDRIKDLLTRFDLPLRSVEAGAQQGVINASLQNTHDRLVTLLVGSLHAGFLSRQTRQWWLTDEEIFGEKQRRAAWTVPKTQVFSSFSELAIGDFLVHMDHGVGIYRGLAPLPYDAQQNDFLAVEYLGGDRLYVPVDKLNRVQRFVAGEESLPQIDRLGGTTWAKVRANAKKAARRLAKELLTLQAERAVKKAFVFLPHMEALEEFAGHFPFEETPDQLRSLAEVFQDMEGERPMDRLVCGDVGYGKTEIAMRAAFKAVQDGKQVAVLVPTTVLAFQHHTTFSERFKNYPVTLDLLSRFRTTAEQREVVKGLKQGLVDVVVGTHRLLSGDVEFRDLGLLIVDEEHRFGVVHKERIKKLKNVVGVITLTATPIPRTLNFALHGIRDLSIINTPPRDRLAVKTYACGFDDVTIRDAILKEVRRGGQVFFVHNRVQGIENMASHVAKLIPEAKTRFAHGQMAEGELEDIMVDFVSGAFAVLVCTTIIESGLDIPNANTMLINRADTLGLAQLYQLRGRVGRSNRQAYCYLIVPDEELMTAKARKRLHVIQKFTELGSGFKIATRDLEIRGAGNILGEEQSGHIQAVGYDMYVHLLSEAIAELKNERLPEDFEPEIQLAIPAKIPKSFVPDESLRLVLYKQLSSTRSFVEIDEMKEEWQDRFGKLPAEIGHLMGIMKLKLKCKELLVSSLKQSGNAYVLSFHPDHNIDTKFFIDAVWREPKQYSFTRDGQFRFTQVFSEPHSALNSLLDLLQGMKPEGLNSPSSTS